ncbi:MULTISPECIES: carbon-nitrogen hydrolase family protein [Ferrimonas]|uniref:carbon-nitrogen hydrolase family protein n=1 Tax=Ferrimonas TaxID=44011 RepID=UPI0003FDFA54|nr:MULTISPECIES: carbon-nitrogen hydrolase family protein [Ferrimonas]USD37262.1 carbon-nitrogen hydrolase family protein [Ferrimonas sp. SCSIO 43195]
MQLYALQCCSLEQPNENLSQLRQLMQPLLDQSGPKLVVLPECALCFDGPPGQWQALAEPLGQGAMQQALSLLASEFGCILVAGTIPIRAEDGRAYAASLVFDEQGRRIGHYNKIHLFDVDVDDATGRYRESDTTCPGDHIEVIDTAAGRIGVAVCYDLRFPELFRALASAGADVVVVPSAFTQKTGAAHWRTLLQARALENQCYVVAANQAGTHGRGRQTWGHSMVVDPWGRVLDELAQQPGLATARLDQQRITEIRRAMPVLNHIRLPLGVRERNK